MLGMLRGISVGFSSLDASNPIVIEPAVTRRGRGGAVDHLFWGVAGSGSYGVLAAGVWTTIHPPHLGVNLLHNKNQICSGSTVP
jgi:hypothetical protein